MEKQIAFCDCNSLNLNPDHYTLCTFCFTSFAWLSNMGPIKKSRIITFNYQFSLAEPLFKELKILNFFNCYLAAPYSTLGHYQGHSLTHLIIISAFYIFNPEVTRSLTSFDNWCHDVISNLLIKP